MLNQRGNDGTGREWGTGDQPARRSQGWRKTYADDAGAFIDLKLESPEPKQIRVAYSGPEWEQGRVFLVWVEIRQSIDGSVILQRQLIPWQGACVSVPAGACEVRVTTENGFQSLPASASTTNTINVQLSAGLPGLNYRRTGTRDLSSGFSDGWFNVGVNSTRIFPPLFAVGAVLQNYGPDPLNLALLSQALVVPIFPQAYQDMPLPDPGFFDVSSGGQSALAVFWRVSA